MDDPGGLSRQISRLQKPSRTPKTLKETSKSTSSFFTYTFTEGGVIGKNPALVTDICHLLQPDDSCLHHHHSVRRCTSDIEKA